MKIEYIDFNVHGDNRGSLIAIENNKDIPFTIKRVYYIYDTLEDVTRGYHAHKKLQQVLIAVNGSCKVKLDDGKDSSIVELSSPSKGLIVGNNIWREMSDFKPGTVLLVLASEEYNENDYIRDYDDFINYIKNEK